MLKLAKKSLLIIAPILLYFGVFIYFEPYNYFGIKNTEYSGDSAIYRVRQYKLNPKNTIILGDSRMAHFDMEKVEEYAKEPVSQLSFGGAAFNESMDLLEFAIKENPSLKKVYFGVSFYTLNKSYYKDRMSQIETISANPFAYMLNFNYNVEMLNEIKYFFKGEKNVAMENVGSWTEADYLFEDGTPRPYRKILMDYAETIASVCKDYALDTDDVERYTRLLARCKEKGIAVYTVLPPMDVSLKNEVVDKLGIDKDIKTFIAAAEQDSVVLNYEYTETPVFTEDMFYDGFHLDGLKGLPQFTKMLFER